MDQLLLDELMILNVICNENNIELKYRYHFGDVDRSS